MTRNCGLLALLTVGVSSCQTATDTGPLTQFEIPIIQQPALPSNQQPAALLRADSIQAVYHRLVGRFSFARRLDLEKPDSLGPDRYGLDSGQPFNGFDGLNTDGLELIADYRTTIPFRESSEFPVRAVYPVYIVNSTPRTKILCGKDAQADVIQEAIDRTGEWRPIESQGPEFCGNGDWMMKIRPRQMVVLLVDKYQGNFKTRLRVRLRNGNSRYVSVAYEGWISETQFLATHRETRLLEKDKLTVTALYYGAIPAALDSLDAREKRAKMAKILAAD